MIRIHSVVVREGLRGWWYVGRWDARCVEIEGSAPTFVASHESCGAVIVTLLASSLLREGALECPG